MAMHAQTPVQIAWVARDIESTEHGKGASGEFLDDSGPGLHHVALSASDAAVPYLEIAYIPPEIPSFFDYVKQEQP